jgi:replicative DNA helicase
MTLGLGIGELVILGGYTSRGKTQLAVNIAWNVAAEGKSVLFVTLEMTKAQLTSRFMRLGEIDANTPIFFQAMDVLEIEHIGDLIRRAKEDGVGLVVIDHLHYFARGKNMLEQVGLASREFKRFALTYELPVLLLSQLSRPIDKKVGRLPVPGLSSLKESGYVEQDADIVLMVHRDLPDDEADTGIDENEVVVVQRKNRPRGMRRGHNLAQLRHNPENGVLLTDASLSLFSSRGR